MTKQIIDLEGIGSVNAQKLQAVGIKTIGNFLEQGTTPSNRANLAKATGISRQLLLKWLGMADLYRITRVGAQFAELLKASGVDTVRELRQRNANNLTEALLTINEEHNLARTVPALVQVRCWIEEAKTLTVGLTY